MNTQKDENTLWQCECAKCGYTWTSNTDDLKCPDCGEVEGVCVEATIWECTCAACGEIWTSFSEDSKCPTCGAINVECGERTKSCRLR